MKPASQDARVLEGVLEDSLLNGGEHQLDIRRIGSLRETDKLVLINLVECRTHTEDRG